MNLGPDYKEVACLGCPLRGPRYCMDENGLCAACVTRQIACEWFSRQPHIWRDAAFDTLLEAEIEREKLPERALNDALLKWLYAPISR